MYYNFSYNAKYYVNKKKTNLTRRGQKLRNVRPSPSPRQTRRKMTQRRGQLFILEMKVSQTLQWTWEWKADPLPWKLLTWGWPCPLFPTRQMPKFCHSPEVAYWKLYQTLLQCEFGSSIFSIWSTSLIGSFTVCSTGHCTSSSLLCVFLK